MIKAVIIDDEPHCVTALQNDLNMFCPEVVLAGACHSAKEGIMAVKQHSPDLVFLDVEMPWMNGFEMLEVMSGSITFQIIFTTAYDQFATKAFRVSAVDYLLKPIDSNDLIQAVAKIQKSLPHAPANSNISNLLLNSKKPVEEVKIAIPTREGYEFIAVTEIIYCKAEGAYTYVVLSGNRKLLLSKSLGETEQMLPEELFERVHHSMVVNIKHIQKFIKSNGSSIVMDNGDELGVSKSKKDQLLLRLGIR